jgi:cell division protein FtsQ
MPLSGAFTARVPLIFAQNEAEAELGFSYLSALTEDDLWRAFTDGLVIQNEQVELIPRLGSARIELGEIDELPRQMHYLDAFYREQIARGNLNDYKKISLQYEGQIVAQRHY